MKVYLVLERSWGGDDVLGIYTTKKEANKAKRVFVKEENMYCVVEERDVIESFNKKNHDISRREAEEYAEQCSW